MYRDQYVSNDKNEKGSKWCRYCTFSGHEIVVKGNIITRERKIREICKIPRDRRTGLERGRARHIQ